MSQYNDELGDMIVAHGMIEALTGHIKMLRDGGHADWAVNGTEGILELADEWLAKSPITEMLKRASADPTVRPDAI